MSSAYKATEPFKIQNKLKATFGNFEGLWKDACDWMYACIHILNIL